MKTLLFAGLLIIIISAFKMTFRKPGPVQADWNKTLATNIDNEGKIVVAA